MTSRAQSTTDAATRDVEQFRARAQDALFGAIDEHVERLSWSRQQIAEVQRDRLRGRCWPSPSNGRRSTPGGSPASTRPASS